MELEEMVRRARGGDLEAFEAVTRRFQQMAFGSALALVRDLQEAEDIVQETFAAAWFALPTLAEPAAFSRAGSGALSAARHIGCCDRSARSSCPSTRPIAAALEVAKWIGKGRERPSGATGPAEH